MMHGECKHVLYVRALLGDPPVNLKAVPVLRKRGRNRKQGCLDSAPKTATKAQRQREGAEVAESTQVKVESELTQEPSAAVRARKSRKCTHAEHVFHPA